jgi:hypothetical protein
MQREIQIVQIVQQTVFFASNLLLSPPPIFFQADPELASEQNFLNFLNFF